MEAASNNKSEIQITQEELKSLKRSVKELMDIVKKNSDWFENNAIGLKSKIIQLNTTLARYANPADFSSENIETIKDIYSDFSSVMVVSHDFDNSRKACGSVLGPNNDNSLTDLISLMNNANAELKKYFENRKSLGDLIDLFRQTYNNITGESKPRVEYEMNKLNVDNTIDYNLLHMFLAAREVGEHGDSSSELQGDDFIAKHKIVKAILARYDVHTDNLKSSVSADIRKEYIERCLGVLLGATELKIDDVTVDQKIDLDHPLSAILKKLFNNPHYKLILSKYKKNFFQEKGITVKELISIIGIIDRNLPDLCFDSLQTLNVRLKITIFSSSIVYSNSKFLEEVSDYLNKIASINPSAMGRLQLWKADRLKKKTIQTLEPMQKIDGQYVSKSDLTSNEFLEEISKKLRLLYTKCASSRSEIDSFFSKYTVTEEPDDKEFTCVNNVIYTNYKNVGEIINKALKIIKRYYRQIDKKYSEEELTDFKKRVEYGEELKSRANKVFSQLELGNPELTDEYSLFGFINYSLPEKIESLKEKTDIHHSITKLIEESSRKKEQLGLSTAEYVTLFIEELEKILGIADEAQAKEKEGEEMETNQGTNTNKIISDAKDQLFRLLKDNALLIDDSDYKRIEQQLYAINPDAENQNAEMKSIAKIIIDMNNILALPTILNDIIEKKNSGSLNTDGFVIQATNIIANQRQDDHRASRVSPLNQIFGWFRRGKKDNAEEAHDIDLDDVGDVLFEEANDEEIVEIIKSTDKALRKLAKTLSKYKNNGEALINSNTVLKPIDAAFIDPSTFFNRYRGYFIFNEIKDYLNEKYGEQLDGEVTTIANAINGEFSLESCEAIIKSANKIIRKLKVKTYITRVLVGTGVVGVLFIGSKLFNNKSNETKQPEQPTDSVVDYQNTTTEPAVTEDHIEMPSLTEATEPAVVTTETTYTTEATIGTTYTTEIAETSEPTSSNQYQEPSEDVVVDPEVVKNVTDTLIAYGIDNITEQDVNDMIIGNNDKGREIALTGQLIPVLNDLSAYSTTNGFIDSKLPEGKPPVIRGLFGDNISFEFATELNYMDDAIARIHEALTKPSLSEEEKQTLLTEAGKTLTTRIEYMLNGSNAFMCADNTELSDQDKANYFILTNLALSMDARIDKDAKILKDGKYIYLFTDNAVSTYYSSFEDSYGYNPLGRTYNFGTSTSSTSTDNN